MSGELVLSLFPGIGLLDMAFERAGWCVVRGPDLLWGGDVRSFSPPPMAFEGVIGGPPCPGHSSLRSLASAHGSATTDLNAEFARCVLEAEPAWFVMENAPKSPPPPVTCRYNVVSRVLDNHWLGETAQGRKRRFFFGTDGEPYVSKWERCNCCGEYWCHLHNEHVADCRCPGVATEAVTAFHIRTPALVPIEREAVVLASGGGPVNKRRMRDRTDPAAVRSSAELQGLPPEFLADSPLTQAGKQAAIGNGVPLPMGTAVAAAVERALQAG